MIAIIDYGMGNLRSVQNALDAIDCESIITNDLAILKQADGWILPGVGAFPDCMANLHAYGLVDTIIEKAKEGMPILGICLGMQVLFDKGYEVRECDGLGLLKGEIRKMEDTSVKIPHIGWNKLEFNKDDTILSHLCEPFVYYVHSFYVCAYEERDLLGYSQYGTMKVPGMFRKDNLCAAQFHPEKSGSDGLQILKNYKEFVQCRTQTKSPTHS